ncbi:MAG TPA: hypothetical protein DDW76_17380 [Cyanobacteria bacterium UBA11369]|nr:hypothetical protein [Cyanobacteria bacterium UBA11371]HBE33006.1 hypothetical protein [Cyanobacteria bacterium UBA11368]HBE50516.1 hypothetical protein [Cyanobacteria bacterium UBA11369]
MGKPQRDTGDSLHLQILKTCKPYSQLYSAIFVSFNTLALDTYSSFKIKYGKLIELPYFAGKTPKASTIFLFKPDK